MHERVQLRIRTKYFAMWRVLRHEVQHVLSLHNLYNAQRSHVSSPITMSMPTLWTLSVIKPIMPNSPSELHDIWLSKSFQLV